MEISQVRRLWRQYTLARWQVIVAMVLIGVVAVPTVFYAIIVLDHWTAGNVRSRTLLNTLLIYPIFLVAFGIWMYALDWWLLRVARTWGMVCSQCNTKLQYKDFVYRSETGRCPHCVRKDPSHSSPTLAREADWESSVTSDDASVNPYAPPMATASEAAPPSTLIPWFTWPTLFSTCLVFTTFGWLSALFVTGIVCLVEYRRFARGAQTDDATPAWMRRELHNDLWRELLQLLLLPLIVAAVVAVVLVAWRNFNPDARTDEFAVASHFAVGAALSVAFLILLQDDRRAVRNGFVVPKSSGVAAAHFPPALAWTKASHAVGFRTQSARGIVVTITDTLTDEQLVEQVFSPASPDAWTEIQLPFRDPNVAGRNWDRLKVGLRSLDSRPWLLRYA